METNIESIDDFVTVVADGAYIHYNEGFLCLLFFRDKIFPSHSTKGEVNKTRVKREILHEVRLAIPIAKTINKQLQEGLSVYAELGFLPEERDFWSTVKLKQPSSVVGYDMEGDEMDKVVWGSYHDMYTNCTKEGQGKMLNSLTQYLHENIENIRKIAQQHAKPKKKVDKRDKRTTNSQSLSS